MSTEIYLEIEDAEGNLLTEAASSKESIGAYYKEAHADAISVFALEHRVMLPTDNRVGAITSNRRHEGLTITKMIDKSSPLLFNLMGKPTELTCSFEFYRSSDITNEGEPELFYTIELEEAKIIALRTVSPNRMLPENDHLVAYEEVTFTYGSITWEHPVGSTNALDKWAGE
ncbi:MAG: type VI secretion system tube protein Hcp [Gammaproteobacteria bacterium]|jgi:type VI secretion system secreted protein Hcp|nr:type VI secretion system tube protein Hcp [Gammaproteobacteria bacterium]